MPSSGAAPVNPRQAVSLPSIFLIITGVLGVLGALIGFVTPTKIPDELLSNPDLAPVIPYLEKMQSGGSFTNLLVLITSGVVIFGALKMRNLQSHGLAMAASIIAIIPCFGPCCCIGIPAGIWALVVINKPEVKSAFTK